MAEAAGTGEPGPRPGRLIRLTRWIAALAAAALIGAMLFTTADVLMRYLLGAPIRGSNEISEALMVVIIMLAMPLCGANDGHVRVDLLDGALGRQGCRFVDVLTGLLGIGILWFLVNRALAKAIETHEFGDHTTFAEIPLWPMHGLVVVGMGLYGVVLIIRTVCLIRGLEHG